MKDVKDIGEKAREDAKRDLIFKILTIIFLVVPFVGEALGPLVGSVASGRALRMLIGEAGNAALTVAEIVAYPTSAPFAILGLLAGAVEPVPGGRRRCRKLRRPGDYSEMSTWPSFPEIQGQGRTGTEAGQEGLFCCLENRT